MVDSGKANHPPGKFLLRDNRQGVVASNFKFDCLVLKHVVHLVANVAPFVQWVVLKVFDRQNFDTGRVSDIDVEILFVLALKKLVGHNNPDLLL